MIQAVLGERYRLGERIARGGMGSVYRAVDENLGRQVAVKVLRRELAVGTLVVIALLLLAWLPRGEPSDPPAGQSERPHPASPTTVDNGDEDD